MKNIRSLLDLLEPDLSVSNIAEIDFSALALKGHHYFIIDIDNTIAKRGSTHVSSSVKYVLQRARRKGWIKGICLVSNVGIKSLEREKRIQAICQELEIKDYVCAYWPRTKPHSEPFIKAMKLLGSNPGNTAVIGDQLFTDILGGNLLGLFTILVRSLGSDHLITAWKRWLEWIVFKINKRKHVFAAAFFLIFAWQKICDTMKLEMRSIILEEKCQKVEGPQKKNSVIICK